MKDVNLYPVDCRLRARTDIGIFYDCLVEGTGLKAILMVIGSKRYLCAETQSCETFHEFAPFNTEWLRLARRGKCWELLPEPVRFDNEPHKNGVIRLIGAD
ncbi:MAG: hypothetical protein LBS99_02520 [Clostridiales bacterium]|nr:hypothetical protein [Clostridiales bacterium]